MPNSVRDVSVAKAVKNPWKVNKQVKKYVLVIYAKKKNVEDEENRNWKDSDFIWPEESWLQRRHESRRLEAWHVDT